jgi:hypothetical protein
MQVVLHASERSVFQFNSPRADAIEEALRAAAQGLPGRWVGPLARVTRRAVVGDGFFVYVTWVFALNPGTPRDAAVASLRERVDAELGRVSRDFTRAAVWDYAEAANGPIAWWESGGAANESRSRVAAPTMTARLDTDDNPIGPTTALNSPTSPSDLLGGGGGTRDSEIASTVRLAAGAVIAVTAAGVLAAYVPASAMPWNWGREDRERRAREARDEEDRRRRERRDEEDRERRAHLGGPQGA